MPLRSRIIRRTVARGAVLGLGLALAGGSQLALAHPAVTAHDGSPSSTAPEVFRSRTSPTGYAVTFRLRAPSADRVQIKGEWYLGDPDELPLEATGYPNPVQGPETPGYLPKDWQPGRFPVAKPNTNAANWPVLGMKKGRGGVWTFTTPLPSGVFSYGFYIDCATADQVGCTEVSDPGNRPWNETSRGTVGPDQPVSQIYVPADPQKGAVDYSWQAPSPVARGRLVHLTYPSPTSTGGTNGLVVYTPPKYDPKRAKAYKTLYLAHGNGSNEIDWSTQGAARDILDNLINSGQLEPIVVVMPTSNDITALPGASGSQAAYGANLIDSVIPFIQSRYHVSTSAADRALAGNSAGSGQALWVMFNRTTEFNWYAAFSRGPSYAIPTSLTAEQAKALDDRAGIFVGSAWTEGLHQRSLDLNDLLVSGGVTPTTEAINGGHNWYTWRILLADFLKNTAFRAAVDHS